MSDALIDLIKTRRSVRSYAADPVDEAVIRDVVDCGRLAATANNLQPWEFVIVRDKAARERLAEVCPYGKFLDQAPVCIVVFCRDGVRFLEDGSAAMQNLLLAAWAHNLGTCWVAGHNTDHAPEVCRLLKAPTGQRLVGLVALGHVDKPAKCPPKRGVDEVIHWDTF